MVQHLLLTKIRKGETEKAHKEAAKSMALDPMKSRIQIISFHLSVPVEDEAIMDFASTQGQIGPNTGSRKELAVENLPPYIMLLTPTMHNFASNTQAPKTIFNVIKMSSKADPVSFNYEIKICTITKSRGIHVRLRLIVKMCYNQWSAKPT